VFSFFIFIYFFLNVGKCSIFSGCSFSRLNLEKEHPLFLEQNVGKFFEKKKIK
jgi:hypothetical protein